VSRAPYSQQRGRRRGQSFGGLLLLVLVLAIAFGGRLYHSLGKSGGAAEAAPAVTAGKVGLIEEPGAGDKPFVSLISHARRSVELTMYELGDRSVENALIGARARGVQVRVLLDRTYAGGRVNLPAYRYLRARHVMVRWAPAYNSITHQKTLTVDGRVSAVMTLNLDGGYSSTRDFAVTTRAARAVTAIVRVFDADWNSRKVSPSTAGGALLWSPNASTRVVQLIESASRSVDVESEELSYKPAVDALCAAARRGVDVRVVMTYSSSWQPAFRRLDSCGARLRVFYGQRYYIHAKILDVDNREVLVGSQNLSTESLIYNRELGIVVTARKAVSALTGAFNSDYSAGQSWR
jgi:cardiolipin synthase A/B